VDYIANISQEHASSIFGVNCADEWSMFLWYVGNIAHFQMPSLKNRVNKTNEFSKNCKVSYVISYMCKGRAFLARKGPSYKDTFCL